MKRLLMVVGFVLASIVNVFAFSACIPPFIDGLVEAPVYFEETVRCKQFTINPDAVGGYEIEDCDSLYLSDLTDNDEKNTVMQRYYSFSFKAKEEIVLQAVAFIVEAQEGVFYNFRLKNADTTHLKSVEIEGGGKRTVEFSDLDIAISSSSELIIELTNPVLSNVPYRIDSILFVV